MKAETQYAVWVQDARQDIALVNAHFAARQPIPHPAVVRVRFIGRQSGFGLHEDFDLYNILEGQPNAYSTVTLESLRAQGFLPEVVAA